MQSETRKPERDERQPSDKKIEFFDPWRDAFLKDMKRNDRDFDF